VNTTLIDERLKAAASEVRAAARQMPGQSTERLDRHRRLRSFSGMVVTASLILVSFGLLGRVMPQPSVRETAGSGASPSLETSPAEQGSGFLSLDGASLGLELVGAHQYGPNSAPEAGDHYLQVLRTSANSLTPPVVWVLTDTDGSDMVGDPGAEAIDLDSSKADVFINDHLRVLGTQTPKVFLGWETAEGEAVFLGALGLPLQDATDLAASLRPREGEPGWVLPEGSRGLTLIYEGSLPLDRTMEGFLRSVQTWAGSEGEVQLLTANAGQAAYEEWLFSVFDDATAIENTVVRGVNATVVEADFKSPTVVEANLGVIVAWREPNGTAVFLELYGPQKEALQPILGALTEIDGASWQRLLETRWEEGPSGTTPPSTTPGEAEG
jgi:hypothetical protein